MKALITGAAGMIGTSLTRRLVGRGDEVRGLLMPDEPDPGLADIGVEIVRGDITRPETLKGLADGCDRVFHLAGRVQEWGRRSQYREAHYVGTTNMLRECAPKVDRFIYFSSTAYYGTKPAQGRTEEYEPEFTGLPYPDMKMMCERLVRTYAAERGLKYTIIRPCNVIATRSAHLLNIVDSFLKGPVPLIDGCSYSTSFVYVENLVDGVVLAADSEKAVNREYAFVDDYEVTWGEYLTDVAALLGKKPIMSLSYRQAYAIATVAEYLFMPFNIRPPFTRFAVTIIGQENHVDSTRAREELGWKTRVPWDEVWAEIEEYVKANFVKV
jgi:nucleoside-diphosphate-sugar epimerase